MQSGIPDRVTLVLDGEVLGEDVRGAASGDAKQRFAAVPVDSIFDLRFISDSAGLASYGLCPWALAAVATTAAEARRLGLRHPPPPLCVRTVGSRNITPMPYPVGTEFLFVAGQRDMLGECDRAAPPAVHWRSSAPAVAVVDSAGRLRAVSPGVAEVIATSGDAETRIAVTVVPAVARLEIHPRDTMITVGDTVRFRAVAIGKNGRPMPDVVPVVYARESRASYASAGRRGPPGVGDVYAYGPSTTRRAPNEVLVIARRAATGYVFAEVVGRRDSVRVQAVAP